jgi:predicted ATP-grasp superfamily ATP-dependent carboligase
MKEFIIIGLTAQGLSLMRTLCRAGYKVIAFTNNSKVVGFYSKYGDKRIFSSISDLKQQIEIITKSRKEKFNCIISSGELLALIISEYSELYDICNVQSGPLSIVKMLSHKNLMYKFASDRGLKSAKYKLLSEYQYGDLKFPVILKRNYEIPLFFKVKKIETETELSYFVKNIKRDDYKYIIIQEFIDVINCQFLTYQAYLHNGENKGYFIGIQKRRLSKGLTCYIQEIVDQGLINLVSNQSTLLFKGTKYTGFVEIEYLYKQQGNFLYFMEVNTRPCGTHSILDYKFSNLSALYNSINNPPQLIKRSNKPIAWINLLRDIKVRIQTRDFKNLSQFFDSKVDILDRHDLKPFIFQIVN